MLLETLRRGLSRLREQPAPLDPSLIADNFCILNRGLILMCLVDRLAYLPHSQVETIAQALYEDTKQSRVRPFSQACRRMHIPGINMRDVLSDPVLQRTALSYSTEEMEREYSPMVTDPDDPPSEVDAIAGSGPARPLIRGLYRLETTNSWVFTGADPDNNQEVAFYISYTGKSYAEAIRKIYEHVNWGKYGNPLVVAGKNGAKLENIPHRS